MNQPAKDQGTSGGSADSVGPNVVILSGTPAVQARFTGWSLPAGVGDHFYDASGRTTPATFRDCQFSGGRFTIYPGSVSQALELPVDGLHTGHYKLTAKRTGATAIVKVYHNSSITAPDVQVGVAQNAVLDITYVAQASSPGYD